jgi:transcriptional antiterminator NusG
MDEHEPEERTESAPLKDEIGTASEAPASEADSTRDSAAGDASSTAEVAASGLLESAVAEEEGTQEALDVPASPVVEDAGEGTAKVEAPSSAAGPESPSSGESQPAPSAVGAMRGGRMPQGEVAAGASTEPAWYVIHCYSGYENKVRHNLEQRIETMGMKDRIFDVVIPTQEEIEVREGKRRTVERHIFPGYVLVNMTLSEESWYVVRNTPGVTGFVGMGNLPTALRPEEVSQIIKRMEAEAPTVKVSFKVGERVRIIDGPFNDFRGTVADIDMERTKVRVMVSFFGRETPVELDFLQVEKA